MRARRSSANQTGAGAEVKIATRFADAASPSTRVQHSLYVDGTFFKADGSECINVNDAWRAISARPNSLCTQDKTGTRTRARLNQPAMAELPRAFGSPHFQVI